MATVIASTWWRCATCAVWVKWQLEVAGAHLFGVVLTRWNNCIAICWNNKFDVHCYLQNDRNTSVYCKCVVGFVINYFGTSVGAIGDDARHACLDLVWNNTWSDNCQYYHLVLVNRVCETFNKG